MLDVVWAQHADLSPYGLALLGLAMHLSRDARTAQLAAQLESLAKADASEAYWPVTRNALMDFEGDATPEATAYAMKLLTALNPLSPLLPKAAAWLVNHRNEGFYWYSMKQTAMVMYGLIDYLRASRELQPNFNVVVAVNGKQVITRQFIAADVIAPAAPVLRIPAGTEFIERDDLYALKDRPPWWTTWYTRREFHDDRATFFQTYFWRSQAQYVYLLKVVTPGRFRVSPARVQPMYQPRYFATTESKVVEVK